MKILILSVTAGYGHHATALAMESLLCEKGAVVKNIDLLKYSNKILYGTVDKGYTFSTKYLPKQFGQVYTTLEKNRNARRLAISNIVTELLASRFSDFFNEFMPDVIICTHIFAAMVMDDLKQRNEYNLTTIGILTDYTFHPYWNDLKRIEYIVTGSPLLKYKAAVKNIPEGRILPFGIPVHSKFLKKTKKEEARELLGLEPEIFTVLCMSGSMGFGDMEKAISDLDGMDDKLQIICVCGKNSKILSKLESTKYKKTIKIYGFTDMIELMMDASDCIVTKPGGLTTTECMTKRLPMIFINPIPGQEDRNSEFLTACGVAVRCTKHFTPAEAVYMLKNIEGRLEDMKNAVSNVIPPDAAGKLANFVMELGK